MALIKYSAIISEMRGKLNGSVFARNRGGAFARVKVTPVNPSTPAQKQIRKQFAKLSSQWRTLTEAQLKAWNQAVEDFIRTNIFGDKVTPSGFNLFMRLNMNLYKIGQDTILEPPVPAAVDILEIVSFNIQVVGDTIEVVIQGPTTPRHSPFLTVTRPMSPGINNAKNQLRAMNFNVLLLIQPGRYMMSFGSQYKQKYGKLSQHRGQRFFFQVTPIDQYTGLNGIPVQRSVVIP